jgi:hypothetical protein
MVSAVAGFDLRGFLSTQRLATFRVLDGHLVTENRGKFCTIIQRFVPVQISSGVYIEHIVVFKSQRSTSPVLYYWKQLISNEIYIIQDSG